MGLGKTATCVAFAHTVLSTPRLTDPADPAKTGRIRTILVLCPVNAVGTWRRELKHWTDKIGEGEYSKLKVRIVLSESPPSVREKKAQLKQWYLEGGVLVMGHDLFRSVTDRSAAEMLDRGDAETEKAAEGFAHVIKLSLINPGPDVVIVDEAHIIKNEKTKISKQVNLMATRRRICLTGTPIQNNLGELYQMLNFVKPEAFGTKKEFNNTFRNPIMNGRFSNSEDSDVRRAQVRSNVLHTRTDAVVMHQRNFLTLYPYLPSKVEYTLFLKLTPKQMDIYQRFLELFVGQDRGKEKMDHLGLNLLENFHYITRILIHPYAQQQNQEKTDGEQEGLVRRIERERAKGKDVRQLQTRLGIGAYSEAARNADIPGQEAIRRIQAARADGDFPSAATYRNWWSDLLDIPDDNDRPELGVKFVALFHIIRKCEEAGDKLVVFSQSLVMLDYIQRFLQLLHRKGEWFTEGRRATKQGVVDWAWDAGSDFSRIEGKVKSSDRVSIQNRFNDEDNSRLRLLLISTRAGCMGIDLIGANRVVILNTSWNPVHDIQSIFRIYRLGQTKPCYVYRLIAQGTMEEIIYRRQVTKISEARRVQENASVARHYTAQNLIALYDFQWAPDMGDHVAEPKDRLLKDLMDAPDSPILKVQAHDSLLALKETHVIQTPEELEAAKRTFEAEQQREAAAATAAGTVGLAMAALMAVGADDDGETPPPTPRGPRARPRIPRL